MNAKERAAIRATLTQLRAQVTQTAPAKIEPNRTDETTSGVSDEDAQALSEMFQVLASQRNKGQAELLGRIDRALRKLAETPEDFGLCESCEEEIAPKRLAVMPYATLCTACQAKAEPRHQATRRSLTDYKG
jgi:DnaK suppressor protein